MTILIFEADRNTIGQVKKGGSSFPVHSKLVLHADQGRISHTTVDVPAYTKQYGAEEFEPNSYLDHPGRVILFAYVDEELAGQIRLQKWWNGYAYIDDLAVEEGYRRQGVGRKLIESAITWAKTKGLPGIMLETQNNNVPACRLYESCGFQLCGFDTHLYKALDPDTDEIALYWYLMF
jgi:ribosomal protein S18 acetylase RimI-like enzyme